MATDRAYYDDEQLWAMFDALEPRRRTQALKGAMRRTAGLVRRRAVGILRRRVRVSDRSLEKGVRAVVWRRKAGFRVTVGTSRAKGGAGFYKNAQNRRPGSRGRAMPVLIWLEDGTAMRPARRTIAGKLRASRGLRGSTRGRLTPRRFMDEARRQSETPVTSDLHRQIVENINRIAKKYGCTTQ